MILDTYPIAISLDRSPILDPKMDGVAHFYGHCLWMLCVVTSLVLYGLFRRDLYQDLIGVERYVKIKSKSADTVVLILNRLVWIDYWVLVLASSMSTTFTSVKFEGFSDKINRLRLCCLECFNSYNQNRSPIFTTETFILLWFQQPPNIFDVHARSSAMLLTTTSLYDFAKRCMVQ